MPSPETVQRIAESKERQTPQEVNDIEHMPNEIIDIESQIL